ncbi:MAG: tripartite tricarboxylate transporter substrate binding protein [Burkholderiales bacterium]|nr:tripartite tricarboxylate transporter substrate binding protein [Burkholderiales bacterium]
MTCCTTLPGRTARHLVSGLLAGLALLAGLPAAAQSAGAAGYPSRPLQMIVPFPAGAPVDLVARSFAQALDCKLGQRVVVLNREGGSTTVGMNALLGAPADGYTFVYGPVTALTVHLHWMKGLQFKAESFVPVCQTFENIFILATRADSPIDSFEAAVSRARAEPGKLTYGHPGVSSSPHLAGAELFQRAGVAVNDVPYRGETPMVPQIRSGDIDMAVVTTGLVITHGMRALAVFSEKRLAAFPNVPTVKELGYAVSPSGYGGLFVRADTPQPIVAALETGCRDALADPAFREVAQRQFQQAEYLDHTRFKARIDADYKSKETLLKTVKLDR